MGRKQKLKREKRANLKKTEELATTTTLPSGSALTIPVTANNNNNNTCRNRLCGCNNTCRNSRNRDDIDRVVLDVNPKEVDRVFPKSDLFVQGYQLIKDNSTNHAKIHKCFKGGAIDYGCIHSMLMIGNAKANPNVTDGRTFYLLAQPWFIEAAIRGSYMGMIYLVSKLYREAQPLTPFGLQLYWNTMITQCSDWNQVTNSAVKKNKENINRKCIKCGQTDTETVTLRQCMGCSMYCYCSEACQTSHWRVHHHRNECKQLQILTKYHKPYAQDIHAAVIRGEINIPALEKLRSKLGLSRPTQDYEELCHYSTVDTHDQEGKTNRVTSEYAIGRKDGTVWIGSFPRSKSIGRPSTDQQEG